ncbi:ABC transporter substrate-binding protein [Aquincola sp. S2]|uniref:ABC transporter substrate-binding protein n=1 Tax=Pseudaquabacterium terrae TaxID=2732868 RepID=A0ABX2EL68_9BURK|nr:ABC transporter substrate-binding protein [Aquabacterium terrae]
MRTRRRLLAAAAGGLLLPAAARAQRHERRLLGLLSPLPFVAERWRGSTIAQRLRELGWIEGGNLDIEQARGSEEELPALAKALVRRGVELILAIGHEAAIAAARATKTTPIVFWAVPLPIESGLVASFAHPGGNVTGVAWNAAGEVQFAKPLQLLKQIEPSLVRVALLQSSTFGQAVDGTPLTFRLFETAVARLGFEPTMVVGRREEDVDAMCAAILNTRVQAVAGGPAAFINRTSGRFAQFARRHRLPTATDGLHFVDTGWLLGYGPHLGDSARRAVDYVDRVLRGTPPAALPVELPTRYELALNVATARAIGVTLPRPLLLQADRVVE